jgi:hypothetical protein
VTTLTPLAVQAADAEALAGLCDQLTAAGARYPGTGLVLRYEVKSRPGTA